MIPWKKLDVSDIPNDGGQLHLFQRDDEFSIRLNNCELMNSRAHGSEEKLAELGCVRLTSKEQPRVLIGGLGMGYTAEAALQHLGVNAHVEIAELLPAVVRWNQEHLGHLAGHPLKDTRAKIREIDVAALIKTSPASYDAILLDVDNGPDGLTHKENDWLYASTGLKAIWRALKPEGVLGVWSAAPSRTFTTRLRQVGYKVQEEQTRARGRGRGRGRGKGSHHTIWLASRS